MILTDKLFWTSSNPAALHYRSKQTYPFHTSLLLHKTTVTNFAHLKKYRHKNTFCHLIGYTSFQRHASSLKLRVHRFSKGINLCNHLQWKHVHRVTLLAEFVLAFVFPQLSRLNRCQHHVCGINAMFLFSW